MKLTYYKNLDGIRAIAALMVMIFHFFQGKEIHSGAIGIFSKIAVFGQTGVDLFFVLSGFLITRILIATKNKQGFFKNFYLRRILRIFPLYYLFLVLTYYVLPQLSGMDNTTFNQQIYYFTYLQNFATTFSWNAIGPSHFWSLAVEEHFYLFWPFIVYFSSIKNLIRIVFGIVIGALLLRVLMTNEGYEVFYFTFTRIDSLAIGSLLAILELKGIFKERNTKKFVLLLVTILFPTIIIWTYLMGTGNYYIQILKYLFFPSIFFSIIGLILCFKANHIINRLLTSKFFLFTAKISYGLYVYHPLAYTICEKYFPIKNIVVNFFTCVALSYVISSISFYLFESTFLKLKKYFEYKKIDTLEVKLVNT